jgi:hypothetical protein
MGNGSFRGTAMLDAPTAGSFLVRVCGGHGQMEFPMHVFPRHAIVHLLVRGGPDGVHEEIAIGADGWAMAFRRGAMPPVRVQLPAVQIDEIRQSFQDAGFFGLEDRYLGEEPDNGLFYQVFYSGPGRSKLILAEDGLAPEALRGLVADLRDLIDNILQTAQPPEGVIGAIEVDPLFGEAGTPRTIRLNLQNSAAEPETLRFDTTQNYDIAVFGPMGMHDAEGMDDPNGSNGGMGAGVGDGGGCGGMGSGSGSGQTTSGADDHESPGQPHLIWNWAYGRTFDPDPTEIVLGPGEVRSYEVTWPGVANDGTEADHGRYRIAGTVPAARRVPVRSAELVVGPPPPPARLLVHRLVVEPREATAGTPREMRLSIGNPSGEAIALTFPTSQLYDFQIFEHRMMHAALLWSWASGRAFERVETPLIVPAHGRLLFAETWDGHGDGGATLGPGSYRARARLALEGPGVPDAEDVRVVVLP